jgi:hypothetical protein
MRAQLLLLLLPALPAFAQMATGSGLIFSRDRVFVEAQVALPAPAPSEDEKKEEAPKEEAAPRIETRRYFFDTDIRPEEALKLEWFHSLANMQSGRAMMILFKDAAPRALPLVKLYKPVDVLVIGDDGTILAILPNIVLANQSKLIDVEMPVKAFLFIKGDEAAALQIKPKNLVFHPLFTRNPTVLQ